MYCYRIKYFSQETIYLLCEYTNALCAIISFYHPRSLYSNVRRVVSDHIDSNEDLFVATFSDYAMYGIRAEVRLTDFEGAKLYQIKLDGEVVISEIDSKGKCQYINGVFDVLRDALNNNGNLVDENYFKSKLVLIASLTFFIK